MIGIESSYNNKRFAKCRMVVVVVAFVAARWVHVCVVCGGDDLCY